MMIEEREYARLLGYPWGAVLEGNVRERAEQAAEWYERNGTPRVYCRTVVWPAGFPSSDEEGWLRRQENVAKPPKTGADGVVLIKRSLEPTTPSAPVKEPSEHFLMARPPLLIQGGEYCFTVTAITAGIEVDEEVEKLWAAGRIDEAYFLDRYAAAVVERLASGLGPHRTPGTGGMPLEEQHRFFAYLAPLNPTIEILPSGMLRPKNSIIAVGAVYDRPRSDNPCPRCNLGHCTFRRTS